MKPSALILQAYGTNRDRDAAEAFALAGAVPEIVPLTALRRGQRRFADYAILVLPGGFSYADALGAGKLLAVDLQAFFHDQLEAFVDRGGPVIGICNGFQALVKAGILPGQASGDRPDGVSSTLTNNDCGQFECRWIRMQPVSQACLWTRGLRQAVACPVAHGEGKFQTADPSLLARLQQRDQIAFTYLDQGGNPAGGAYPHNPNGSQADVAGICNQAGNVLGLMPHPENHIHTWQHPQWTRGTCEGNGMGVFRNGVRYAEAN